MMSSAFIPEEAMAADPQEDFVGLLDVLVFLAEHWIAILLIPVLLSAVAFVVSSQFERGYMAVASIGAGVDPAPIVVAQVLDQARQLSDQNDLDVLVQEGTVVITASAGTRDRAAAIASKAVATLASAARATLDEQSKIVALTQANIERLDAAIERAGAQDVPPAILAVAETVREEAYRDAEQIALAQQWVAQIEMLKPRVRTSGPNPTLSAIGVLLASGFMAFALCVGRRNWRFAMAAPGASEKIERIRASFWLLK